MISFPDLTMNLPIFLLKISPYDFVMLIEYWDEAVSERLRNLTSSLLITISEQLESRIIFFLNKERLRSVSMQ